QVVVRQSLTGASYGLLDEPSLEPRPDYYTSVLWKRLMGTRVLDVMRPTNPNVRAYAHCAAGDTPGAVAVGLINLTPAPVRVGLDLDGEKDVWTLDATSLDSPDVRLNGAPLAVNDDGTLPAMAPMAAQGALTLPMYSVSFVVAAHANAAACR